VKYKLFFFLFLLFFIVYLGVSHLNPDNVRFYVGFGKYYEDSVAYFVSLSFLLGIGVSIIFGFFQDIRSSFGKWRERGKDKKRTEYREIIEKARTYELKGDREKAIESLDRLVKRGPEMEEPYLVLADMYSSMKDYGKAVETLTSGQVHMGKQEALLLRTVKARLAMKNMAKVEEGLREIIGLNESNLEALGLLRDFYLLRKDWAQAMDVEKRIQKFIKTDDEKRRLMGIRYEMARTVFNKKDTNSYEEITTELKEMINEDKRFVPAYILLAETYKCMSKANDAARVYARGWAKTGHMVFLLKMEDLYIDRGDPGVILKIYRRILDLSPKNHLTSFLYARLCLRLEMIDEAIDTLNLLLGEGQEFRGLHRAMAEAYIHRGTMDRAVEEFRTAFPMKHIYIPFTCNNCQSVKEEWSDFCESCLSWNTISVKREEFLSTDSAEIRMLSEREDWAQGGQIL
jgi:lipopolysaccharide biosynthesis regulator YciM